MTSRGNVKTLIEKYNEINLTIERSISPRGGSSSSTTSSSSINNSPFTTSLSLDRNNDHSINQLQFVIESNNNNYNNNNNNNNNFEINNNNNFDLKILNFNTINYNNNNNNNKNKSYNNSKDNSPNMISNNNYNSNNNNNNNNDSCCSKLISSMANDNNNNNNNKIHSWIMPSLKINEIENHYSSSSSIEDEHIQEQLKIQIEQQQLSQESPKQFCLSPKPKFKKEENQEILTPPPSYLDKRRFSRDLIPFTIANI